MGKDGGQLGEGGIEPRGQSSRPLFLVQIQCAFLRKYWYITVISLVLFQSTPTPQKETGMKIKYVRWLGAFGKGRSLIESARFELDHCDREVAVEPCVDGPSDIRANIGLLIDEDQSYFVRGYSRDVFTETTTLFERFLRKAGTADSNGRKWPSVWGGQQYKAVALRFDAPERARRKAESLSQRLGLPLEII